MDLKAGLSDKAEFAPSGLLRQRIERGEKANVFASANMEHPKTLVSWSGRAGGAFCQEQPRALVQTILMTIIMATTVMMEWTPYPDFYSPGQEIIACGLKNQQVGQNGFDQEPLFEESKKSKA